MMGQEKSRVTDRRICLMNVTLATDHEDLRKLHNTPPKRRFPLVSIAVFNAVLEPVCMNLHYALV